MNFPTDPPVKRKASCMDMSGYIDIRAIKKSRNIEPLWTMHYLKKHNQVYSGQPVAYLKTDLAVTQGAVYELMEGVTISEAEASNSAGASA